MKQNQKPRLQTQVQSNPFPYSDSNKRYHTYEYYLRHTFGGKCAKIPLDAGFTCPNIDGRCGVGGCIYCSGRGSGDFAQAASMPLREQYDVTRAALASKWSVQRCIPYFQAHTNTSAPTEHLTALFQPLTRSARSSSAMAGWKVRSMAQFLMTSSLLAQ